MMSFSEWGMVQAHKNIKKEESLGGVFLKVSISSFKAAYQ